MQIKSFINFIKRKINNKSGASETIVMIACTAALMAVFYVVMMAYAPLMTKVDVEAYTKTLVREIEIHGAIDDKIQQFAEELAGIYKFKPEITYDAAFISGTKQIQIRDSFKVTVETIEDVVLLDSTIFTPVTITIPISDQKVGISEKLWK